MKNLLASVTAGAMLLVLPTTAQEIAKVAAVSAPMPTTFESIGDCSHSMSFAGGLRYTFKSTGKVSFGLAAVHEWRTTRMEHGTMNGVEVFSDLGTRSFVVQGFTQYKLANCASACGGELSAVFGADVLLPYHTDATAFTEAAQEGAATRTTSRQTGVGLRIGLRMSRAMCDRMGFFMAPDLGYKLVLDHGDYAAELGLPSQSNDLSRRWTMGMQAGLYLKLTKGMCPMKKG